MIRAICKDEQFLKNRSEEATSQDINIAIDLKDTLKANEKVCVGMAANMIGEAKRIIAFYNNKEIVVMFNPKIVRYFGEKYEVEEGCLSLNGRRKTTRFEKVQVEYFNEQFKKMQKTYNGFVAEIIQHEVDHLDGIII